MNLVRHELGLLEDREPLPDQGHLPCDLFARGQRAGAARRGAAGGLSLVRRLGRAAAGAVRRLCRGQAGARTCSITTTCCSTGRRWRPSRSSPRDIGERFDHVLVDEYQDTNRLQASILLALKPDGRGLTVVGDDAQSIYSFRAADRAQHPRFPRPVRAAGRDRHARPQLPLDPADPRRRQCGDRRRPRERFTKNLWTERHIARNAAAGHRARRGRRRRAMSCDTRAGGRARPARR